MISATRKSFDPDRIPEEIWIEIIVRLPVKSILGSRCVCKPWSRWIKSSNFVRTHLNRINAKNHARTTFVIAVHQSQGTPETCLSLLSNDRSKERLEIQHPLANRKDRVGIYGSSHGLVCLSDQQLRRNSPICIYNPSIGKHVVLPERKVRRSVVRGCKMGLAFGFNPGHNDYKVVMMRSLFNGKYDVRVEVEVFSLSTNTWKLIGEIPSLLNATWCAYGRGVFIKGNAYWTMINKDRFFLVSFDTGSELFEEFLIPEDLSFDTVECTKYKESICLLHLRKKELEGHDIDMWVLKEKTFKKLHSVDICHSLVHNVSISHFRYSLVGFRLKNKLLTVEKRSKLSAGSRLALYDLESKPVPQSIIRFASTEAYYDADIYVESLVLLDI